MTTLTLLIDEHWPEAAAADWVLHGPRGAVLEQGRSEPRHWPAADRRVAILAGAQVSLCTIQLPKSRRQDRARLIAYALEERLPTETEGQHFTLVDQAGGRAVVAIVDGGRLRRVLEACAGVGQSLSAVFGRLQYLPSLPETAVCVDESGMRYWRWPDGSGLSEDILPAEAESVSWVAQRAIQSAAVGRVDGPESVAKALSLPNAAPATPYDWFSARPMPPSGNLLHGPFATKEAAASLGQHLRWPLRLAGAALALHLGAGLGAVLFARGQESEFNDKSRAVFEAAFPGATIVDPVLQMRRQLNELRPKSGGLRDDDLLAVLASLSDALALDSRDAVSSLRFESGAMELSFNPAFGENQHQALIAALEMRGFSTQTTVQGADRLLTVRRSAP